MLIKQQRTKKATPGIKMDFELTRKRRLDPLLTLVVVHNLMRLNFLRSGLPTSSSSILLHYQCEGEVQSP